MESRRPPSEMVFSAVFFLLTLIALGGLALVTARPTQVTSWVEKWSEGIDIMLVVDLSESMEADDLPPTRLIAAKSVIATSSAAGRKIASDSSLSAGMR